VSAPGPALDRLPRRRAECPPELLGAARLGREDGVHADAIVFDVISGLDAAAADPEGLREFAPPAATSARYLSLVLLGCWLLADDWFRGRLDLAQPARGWLRTLAPLAETVQPELFVRDPDRREELVRHCLASLHLDPAGETPEQAEDRLRTLDSLERARLVRDTREQQARARQLREAMKKKAAEEAAAKANREW
jgi:hypothetical protein